MDFNRSILLLRGLPGAGKSTLAKTLSEEGKYPIFSVDDYFTDTVTNEYDFRYQENHKAYKLCEDNCRKELQRGKEKIIVHNTFTMEWEMKPYFEMASEFSYTIYILTVENYHGSGNVHYISLEQLKKMASKYRVKLY